MTSYTRFFAALGGAAICTGAMAADITAVDSTRNIGNQSWAGALGMDFDVLSPITVTTLGAFDSRLDGFVADISVGIFDRNTNALVGPSAVLNGMAGFALGNQRFLDVADFTLTPGQYSIVAVGFSTADMNGNAGNGGSSPTINTGGLISFLGTSRYTGATSLVYPTTIDGGPANRYDAGTFQFSAAVPEPSAYLMALMAAGLLAGVASRRKPS